jgi:hypothetical protein
VKKLIAWREDRSREAPTEKMREEKEGHGLHTTEMSSFSSIDRGVHQNWTVATGSHAHFHRWRN